MASGTFCSGKPESPFPADGERPEHPAVGDSVDLAGRGKFLPPC